jgi:hypothetical protein
MASKAAARIDGERVNTPCQPGSYGIGPRLVSRRDTIGEDRFPLLLALTTARRLPRRDPHDYLLSSPSPKRLHHRIRA